MPKEREKQQLKNEKNSEVEDKSVSSRAVKNIIGSAFIFVLCISMLITAYFAFKDMKNKDALKVSSNDNFSFSERVKPSGDRSSNLPGGFKEKDEDSKSEDKNEEDNSTEEKDWKSKKERPDNNVDFFSDNFRENKVEVRSGMNLLYVILFMIQSFLLGASIMFIIYTNIK